MAIVESLQDFYYGLEDGYYRLLDKLNEHIPVYGIVDPIDKIIPSFLVFLILALGLIGFGAYTLLNQGSAGTVSLEVLLQNTDGNPVPQQMVELQVNGRTLNQATNETGVALFQVPKNSEVQLVIAIEGYQRIEDSFEVREENVQRNYPLRPLQVVVRKTVAFVTEDTLPVNQVIQLQLSCARLNVIPSPSSVSTDNRGEVTVTEPPGCGMLIVTVTGPDNFEPRSEQLRNPYNIIRLQERTVLPPPDAPPEFFSVRVRIEDQNNFLLTDIPFEVSLYRNGLFFLTVETRNGTARFEELEPGEYHVRVSDPRGIWAGPDSEVVEVSSTNPRPQVTIPMGQQIQVNVRAVAIDAETHQPVVGATVVFRNRETQRELKRGIISENGEPISFTSLQAIGLKVEAMAEDYLPGMIETSQRSGLIEVPLERPTPANHATIRVRVMDETNHPVANARVYLRLAETEAIAPYAFQVSDFNGWVEFENVTADELYAFAEKYPAEGATEPIAIELGQEYEWTLVMNLGSTAITINAWNENEELIPNSVAEVWNAQNQLVGTFPLTNGSDTIQVKADKRIFVVVKNPEYIAYQSESFQLFKDTALTIDAVLPSRLLAGAPQAVFIGVFDLENRPVQAMKAGNSYRVRLQLRVPESPAYTSAGLHFRTGSSNIMDNDGLRIIRVNAGLAALVKGITYNPFKGEQTDLSPENLSTGDAKWVNISWHRPQARAYNVVVDVFVKRDTLPNTAMPMYYRGWGIQANGSLNRDPVDEELGTALETSNKQNLYSNAHAIVSYFEGEDTQCENGFCFSNLRVLDLTSQLYLNRLTDMPFVTRIRQPYRLSFILTNNSEFDLEGATVNIRAFANGAPANDLRFLNYRFSNASQQVIEGQNPVRSEITQLDVGEFKPNTGLSAQLEFLPQSLHTTAIEIQVVHNGEIRLTKTLDFETVADQNMLIAFEPPIVPAYAPTTAQVHVTLNNPASEEHGMDLEGVRVKLTIEDLSHAKTVLEQITNSRGFATIELPGLQPNTKLKVEAFKPDFVADPFETKVDGNILLFDPTELQSTLAVSTKTEELLSVNVTNKVGMPLTIKSIRLVGNLSPVLDQTKMNGYLQQLVGHTFRANDEEVLAILKTALSAGTPVLQNETVSASLVFEVENPLITQRLPFTIPVTIGIGLGTGPSEEECLVVDESEFSGTTQDNRLSHSFQLTNNCKVNDQPIVVSNLRAVLTWNEASVGNIDLSLTEGSNAAGGNTVTLLPGESTVLFDQSPTGARYYGTLDFIPKSNKLGETADFSVVFEASIMTDAGPKILKSNPINGRILIANLESCLQYATTSLSAPAPPSPPPNNPTPPPATGQPASTQAATTPSAVIASLEGSGTSSDETEVRVPFGGEGTLTIDSTECGDIDLDIVLCLNDAGCSGGAAEGRIQLSTDRFPLTSSQPTKTIRIRGSDIAGIYGLTISARTRGRDYKQVGIIDVIVDPSPDYYFMLDKYEFFIKGVNSKDTATLTNSNFGKVIMVTAPASNWANLQSVEDDDEDNGLFGSILPLAAAGLLPQMIPPLIDAMGKSYNTAKDVGKEKFGDFKDAKQKAKEAESKLKDLADECKPNEGFCKDMKNLQTGIKNLKLKMNELVKAQGGVLQEFNELKTLCAADKINDPTMTRLLNEGAKIGDNQSGCGSIDQALNGMKTEFGNAEQAFGSLDGGVCGATAQAQEAIPTIQTNTVAYLQTTSPPRPSYLALFNGLPDRVRGPDVDIGTNILPLAVQSGNGPGTPPDGPGPGNPGPVIITPEEWIEAHDPEGRGTFRETNEAWILEVLQGNQFLRFVSTDFGQNTTFYPVWRYQNELVSPSELDRALNAGNHRVLPDNVSRVYVNGTIAVPVQQVWAIGELPLNLAPNHTTTSRYEAIASESGSVVIRHTYYAWWDFLHLFIQTEWYSAETGWVSRELYISANDKVVELPNIPELISGSFSAVISSESEMIFFQATPPSNALSEFNTACQSFTNAGDQGKKMVEDFGAAQELGKWKSSDALSSSLKQSSTHLQQNARLDVEGSQVMLSRGDQAVGRATGKMDAFKTNMDKIEEKNTCVQKTVEGMDSAVNAYPSDTAGAGAPNSQAYLRAVCRAKYNVFKEKLLNNESGTLAQVRKAIKDEAIPGTGDSLDDLRGDVIENLKEKAPDLSQKAGQATSQAQQATDKASKSLGDVSDATKELSKDNGGQNSGLWGNALAQGAQLGLMAAAMDGLFNNDDDGDNGSPPPAVPTVQNPTQVFSIDLRKDNQGIEVDNQRIDGYYDLDTHKVFGDMAKQTVGVVFENKGLQESQPVYSTATFAAAEHFYPQGQANIPASTPFGDFTSGWGLGGFGQTNRYVQKFHLRFVTGDPILPLPPVNAELFSCTQGAMVGRTGEAALPRITLSWKWNELDKDLCNAKKTDFVYCDATQFSIMVLKRLKALNDFLDANPGLPCPANSLEGQLDLDTAPLAELLGEEPFQASDFVNGCWLPETTALYDGYPALIYYVKEAGSSVQWTTEVPNLEALQDLVLFDAYLMQDGFSEDFLNDFYRYYSSTSFSDAPAWFNQDASGNSYNQLFSQRKISFKQKFVASVQLPTSGLYQVDLLTHFSEGWKLFDGEGNVDGNVTVELLAVKQSSSNSPFYYLPFNGLVGLEGSRLNRQGYGVAFEVNEGDAFSISRQNEVQTLASTSSNPIQVAKIVQAHAIETLNSRATQRGFILDIESKNNREKQFMFTPSLATPVLLKMNHAATQEPFSAYYTLLENGVPKTTGNSFSFWTGAGACRDYSGDVVASAFEEKPDRKADQGDGLSGWQYAYAIDWPKAIKGGDVFLKTVLYTPTDLRFALTSNSDGMRLRTADQTETQTIELGGIAGMPFNRRGSSETDHITALDDLFELVKQQAVCVTNTGVRTSFWWNPKTILEQNGSTGTSISAVEQGLQAGQSCIG